MGQGGSFRAAHLPTNVRARIGASLGEVVAGGLSGCDLTVQTSAGSLLLDLRGRFTLKAKAERIVGRRRSAAPSTSSRAWAKRRWTSLALDPGAHRVV